MGAGGGAGRAGPGAEALHGGGGGEGEGKGRDGMGMGLARGRRPPSRAAPQAAASKKAMRPSCSQPSSISSRSGTLVFTLVPLNLNLSMKRSVIMP